MSRTAFVEQSGRITPTHLVKWVTDGVVADGGTITSLNAVLVTGEIISTTTRTVAAATNVGVTVNAIQTYGYSTIGDGGEAFYTKTTGTTLGGFQSADGAWWKIVPFWGFINVKAFGAKGDGITDDSAAIANAINQASLLGSKAIYFPPGIYIITTSAVLTPTLGTPETGFLFFGAGYFTSIIQFGTLSVPTWFYDNGATPRLQFPCFMDLCFSGGADPVVYTDVSVNANGFKITSAGFEQGFKFTRCLFKSLNVTFDMEGTNTASEMKFVDCKWSGIRTAVYVINNTQSFNHEFFGCDIESIFGDVFQIGASGGGAIKIYGGSIILISGTGSDTYFLNLTNLGTATAGAMPFVFEGIRFELRGNTTNLINIANVSQIDINFNNNLFEDQGAVTKANWCVVRAFAAVVFHHCDFFESVATPITFAVGQANEYGQSGRVTFDSCPLPQDWSDRCTLTAFNGGINAINCRGSDVGAKPAGTHWAHDFDLHWANSVAGLYTSWDMSGGTLRSDGSPVDCQLRVKVAQLKLPVDFWPTPQENTLKLPKNCIIKSLHLRANANSSGDATVTTFRISNNNKTVHHLVSNSDQANLTHTGDVDNYYYHVDDTVNERTLRLNSSAVTTGNFQGGIVYVEYI